MKRKGVVLIVLISILALISGCVEVNIQPDGSVEYKEYLEEVFDSTDVFVLDNFHGQVLVEPSNDGQIKIQMVKILQGQSEERLAEVVDQITVDTDYSSTQLFVKTDRPRQRPKGVTSWRVDCRVYLPVDVLADLRSSNGTIMVNGLQRDLKVRTSNASLIIKDHEGNISGNTSNGSIQLERCIGNLDLHTSNAAIVLTNVAGIIKAESSNGNIIIHTNQVIPEASLDTSNASIQFKGLMVQGNIYEMETSNGSIQVWIEPTIGYDLEAKTSNGKVEFAFPIQISGSYKSNQLFGQIGNGGTDLILNTSNGNIQLLEMRDDK